MKEKDQEYNVLVNKKKVISFIVVSSIVVESRNLDRIKYTDGLMW